MRPILRTAIAAACLAALAVPAAVWAAPLTTTIRVEGSTATTIPQSAVVTDTDGTQTLFSGADSITTPQSSAFWQLARATQTAALPFAFSIFDFGTGPTPFVDTIGPDTGNASNFWIYKVNHVTPAVGAGDETLHQGDSVLWYYAGSDTARELDLAVSSDQVPQGQAFTATAVSYDSSGAAAPAAGASVRYGDTVAVADTSGSVTFVARGEGPLTVSATRAGDVRSPALAVCSFAGDPTICNLPRPPAIAAAASGTGASVSGTASASGGQVADTVAPGSRMTFPTAGGRYLRVRGLRGTAGPDRSDIASVQAALAQRVGTLCRFKTASGSWTAPRSCAQQLYLPARSVGGNWLLPVPGKALRPGLYRAWSRATDGAGNRESIGLAGTNTMEFRILPRGA